MNSVRECVSECVSISCISLVTKYTEFNNVMDKRVTKNRAVTHGRKQRNHNNDENSKMDSCFREFAVDCRL